MGCFRASCITFMNLAISTSVEAQFYYNMSAMPSTANCVANILIIQHIRIGNLEFNYKMFELGNEIEVAPL